ncbi:MAG: hypothetical protein AAB575_05675 [Patescibacteria group bacterium]
MGRIEGNVKVSVNYATNGQEVIRLFQEAALRAHLGRVCMPRENLLIDAINQDTSPSSGASELDFAVYFTDIDDRECLEKKFFNGKNHLELLKQKGYENEIIAAMAVCDTGIAFAVEEMLSQKKIRPANLREMIYFLLASPDTVNWHPLVALGTQISTNDTPEVAMIDNLFEVVVYFKSKYTAHLGPSTNRHRLLACSGFLVVL